MEGRRLQHRLRLPVPRRQDVLLQGQGLLAVQRSADERRPGRPAPVRPALDEVPAAQGARTDGGRHYRGPGGRHHQRGGRVGSPK